MDGNEHARRWLTMALLLTMVVAAVFPRGGVGAVVIYASFWIYGLVIVGFTVGQVVLRRRYGPGVPVLRWLLLAISIVALYVAAAYLHDGGGGLVVLFVCLPAWIALLVLEVRDRRRRVLD